MTVHLSEKDAKRLGLTKKSASKKKPMARDGAESRCVACGETFTSDAAETKHLEQTKHARYESVFVTDNKGKV